MKIKKIASAGLEFTVDVEVENTHSYQLSNGCVSHNTISQLVDCGSGIHPRYSKYYLRRVRADRSDPLAKLMIDQGVPGEADSVKPDSTWVFEFPQKVPETSRCKNEISAIQQLEMYKIYKEYYTTHNPSVTIYVKEDEWLSVGAWVYDNFDSVIGLTFLPHSDHSYIQAPYEEITKEKYYELVDKMPNFSWDLLSNYETDDQTEGSRELACAGGACEL